MTRYAYTLTVAPAVLEDRHASIATISTVLARLWDGLEREGYTATDRPTLTIRDDPTFTLWCRPDRSRWRRLTERLHVVRRPPARPALVALIAEVPVRQAGR